MRIVRFSYNPKLLGRCAGVKTMRWMVKEKKKFKGNKMTYTKSVLISLYM